MSEQMSAETSRAGVYVKLALVGAIWGSTFIAGRIVAAEMSAPTAAFGRFLIATLALVALLLIRERGLPRLSLRRWMGFTLLGAIGVAATNASERRGRPRSRISSSAT